MKEFLYYHEILLLYRAVIYYHKYLLNNSSKKEEIERKIKNINDKKFHFKIEKSLSAFIDKQLSAVLQTANMMNASAPKIFFGKLRKDTKNDEWNDLTIIGIKNEISKKHPYSIQYLLGNNKKNQKIDYISIIKFLADDPTIDDQNLIEQFKKNEIISEKEYTIIKNALKSTSLYFKYYYFHKNTSNNKAVSIVDVMHLKIDNSKAKLIMYVRGDDSKKFVTYIGKVKIIEHADEKLSIYRKTTHIVFDERIITREGEDEKKEEILNVVILRGDIYKEDFLFGIFSAYTENMLSSGKIICETLKDSGFNTQISNFVKAYLYSERYIVDKEIYEDIEDIEISKMKGDYYLYVRSSSPKSIRKIPLQIYSGGYIESKIDEQDYKLSFCGKISKYEGDGVIWYEANLFSFQNKNDYTITYSFSKPQIEEGQNFETLHGLFYSKSFKTKRPVAGTAILELVRKDFDNKSEKIEISPDNERYKKICEKGIGMFLTVEDNLIKAARVNTNRLKGYEKGSKTGVGRPNLGEIYFQSVVYQVLHELREEAKSISWIDEVSMLNRDDKLIRTSCKITSQFIKARNLGFAFFSKDEKDAANKAINEMAQYLTNEFVQKLRTLYKVEGI